MDKIDNVDDAAAVRAWLLKYAWLGDADYQRREVDCIMSQDDWKYVDARMEQLRAQASGEEADLETEVSDFALSALYECHDGPHLATCPHARDEVA